MAVNIFVVLMMKMIFILFIYFIHSLFVESRQYLGLFTLTNCEKELECSNALLNENRMVLHHSTKKYSEDVHLCTLDVQNNHEKLLRIILNLTERNSSFTLNCRNNTKMNFDYDNQQILIFTYMSFELTRMASSIILLDDMFIMSCVTDQFMYPVYYFEHPYAIYSYEASFDEEIHRASLKAKYDLEISYWAMLNLHQDSSETQEDIPCSPESRDAWCLYITQSPNDCIKAKDVHISDQKDVDYTIKLATNRSLSFLLLVGGSLPIELFKRKTNLSNFFILPYFTEMSSSALISIPITSYEEFDVILNFPGTVALSDFMFYISDLNNVMLTQDIIWEGILQMEDVQEFIRDQLPCKTIQFLNKGFKCGDRFTFQMWQNIPFPFKKRMVGDMVGNKIVVKSMMLLWKERYYIENIDYRQLMVQKVMFNPMKALQAKPFCDLKKPLCGPGDCLLYTSPSPRDKRQSRMPSSA